MRRKNHRVLLARLDDQAGPAEVYELIPANVTTFREEGRVVAVCGPLEGFLAGVGDTREEALDDFVEGLKALVDYHKHKNQFQEFMCRHFGEGAARVVMPAGLKESEPMEPEFRCEAWQPNRSELRYEVA